MKHHKRQTAQLARTTAFMTALAAFALTPVMAGAQQSYNVGPKNVGPRNIGPGFGGGGYLPNRVTFYLDGDTRVRIRRGGYTASVDGISCSGGVRVGDSTYRLFKSRCNNRSDIFHGGTLDCYDYPRCRWQPSASGRALGFRSETVYLD